ncbi:MAG TPA: SUMF1/EgtB/PvdO family nonheme iron enzyme, partial [Bacteroidales bacterium]|nr:SUMF1/EgtB/PvdO family nonheme iron enzyme [Bacteroidales bacterium]
MINNKVKFNIIIAIIILIFASCKKEYSPTTGWEYNQPKNGGFEVVPYTEQETGPGLVLIEGGTFVMGRTEQDVPYDWNNMPRRVTVSSFYMDQTEIRNLDYLEYLYWLYRVFGTDYPMVYIKALPDTLVWRDRLAYNEPYVETYLRHPAYRDYPVVGVNWKQANDYCAWRTDRVNEHILIREGILRVDPDQQNENNFNTEAYLAGQYEGVVKNDLIDLNPNGSGTRKVRMEDGILLPRYRLPTEAEWEYAALGLIGNTLYERVIERRIYPWNGHILRNDNIRNLGDFVANFKRGRGDNMGVAGNLNDQADITAPVFSYWPNDYGLYNMAGNVAEWVMDVYRPLSPEDVTDFRPFRGNVFQTKELNEELAIAEKDSLGRIRWREVTVKEAENRRNYRKANNINYLDGDYASSIYFNEKNEDGTVNENKPLMYDYGVTSLINDKARIYKGGSWKDRAYWLSPGTKRF